MFMDETNGSQVQNQTFTCTMDEMDVGLMNVGWNWLELDMNGPNYDEVVKKVKA